MNIFNWIKKVSIINKEFVYYGPIENLQEELDELKNNTWKNGFFYSKKVNDLYYKIVATFSVGTMTFSGGFGSGISIHLRVTETNELFQAINLKTKFRIENFLIIFAFLFMFIMISKSNDWSYFSFMDIGIFLTILIWFHIVIKFQENLLLNKITKRLKLKENDSQQWRA